MRILTLEEEVQCANMLWQLLPTLPGYGVEGLKEKQREGEVWLNGIANRPFPNNILHKRSNSTYMYQSMLRIVHYYGIFGPDLLAFLEQHANDFQGDEKHITYMATASMIKYFGRTDTSFGRLKDHAATYKRVFVKLATNPDQPYHSFSATEKHFFPIVKQFGDVTPSFAHMAIEMVNPIPFTFEANLENGGNSVLMAMYNQKTSLIGLHNTSLCDNRSVNATSAKYLGQLQVQHNRLEVSQQYLMEAMGWEIDQKIIDKIRGGDFQALV